MANIVTCNARATATAILLILWAACALARPASVSKLLYTRCCASEIEVGLWEIGLHQLQRTQGVIFINTLFTERRRYFCKISEGADDKYN